MKKIILLVLSGLIIFTGCGVESLNKSKNLIDSGEEGYGTKKHVSASGDIADEVEDAAILSHQVSQLLTLMSYSSTMTVKVDETNAAGGASGNVLTVGNATIGLIKDLLDYITDTDDADYDVNYVYDELIVIRDNMKSIGFLD